MARDADFHGDQWRLSAYLRVKGKGPPRPKRFQQDRQAPMRSVTPDRSANVSLSPTYESVTAVELVQIDSSGPLDSHISEPSPAGVTSSLGDDDLSTASVSIGIEDAKMHEQSGSDTAHGHADTTILSTAASRKVVYTATKKRVKTCVGGLSARSKHPVPENGLVFVRTLTDDGLPLPGAEDTPSNNSVAEIDPIQDSQLDHLADQLSVTQLDVGGSAMPPSKLSHGRAMHKSTQITGQTRIRMHGPVTHRNLTSPPRPASRKASRKGPRAFASKALSDGFADNEMLVSSPKVKKRARTKDKRIDSSKADTYFDKRIGRLQLAKGLLPLSPSGPPLLYTANETPVTGSVSQLEPVNPLVDGDFRALVRDSVDHPRHSIKDIAIKSQLASVIAPLRHDTESSGFDEELDGRYGSSSPHNSSEDIGFLGDGMYNLDHGEEDNFWTQYPGLD